MDNYPTSLAPEFDESGAVQTPFEVWWRDAKYSFPNVPEEVAREWLHRHWGHSPFRALPSDRYKFLKAIIPSSKLAEIRTLWSEYGEDNSQAADQGRFICGEHPERPWGTERIWLTKYMLENERFPTPIICLDNSNGHLSHAAWSDAADRNLPHAWILVEGHTRLNIALHLEATGRFENPTEIYMMHLT